MNNQISNDQENANTGAVGIDDIDEENRMFESDYRMRETAMKQVIEQSEAALRLADNKDFQSIVMDGYLINEPARVVGLYASGNIKDPADRESLREDLIGCGKFKNFLSLVTRSGIQAKYDLEELHKFVSLYGTKAG